MTFEELEDQLPNGFHDASLLRLILDYPTRSATLHLSLLVGIPGSADPEERRGATVKANGLCFCSIELPSADYRFIPDDSGVWVSGYPEEFEGAIHPNQSIEKIAALLAKCPAGISSYRFYSHDWNSFIHIAGLSVEFSWGTPE